MSLRTFFRRRWVLPGLLGLGLAAAVGTFTGRVRASSTPTFDNNASEHPKAWFDSVSETDYFNTSLTRSWQVNETCNDTGAFTVASYNIWHNVPFVADFGDEMEQSLGKVVKCADIIMFQEAWDYDDIIQDGPKTDLANRGYNILTPTNHYCEDSLTGIENDCSGLVIFYKNTTTLVKELGFKAFSTVNGFDVHKQKGAWGAIFAKGGRYYYVFDTHLTYGNNSHLDGDATSDNSRISNVAESLGLIRDSVNANRASYPPAMVLFGGDFNADFDSTLSNNKGYQLLWQAGASGAFLDPYDLRTLGASFGAYETSGFKSNWPDPNSSSGAYVDKGPNGSATGAKGDFDTILVGRQSYFGAACAPTTLQYSGWAPTWRTLSTGARLWPYYTHSDHYGRWLRVVPSCN